MKIIFIAAIIGIVIYFVKKQNNKTTNKNLVKNQQVFTPSKIDIPMEVTAITKPDSPCTPDIMKLVFETYYTTFDGQFRNPVRCKIKYRDEDGKFSERWIDVCGSELTGNTLLHCYCWKVKAPRQFRTSRILECITEEGTVIENPGIYFKMFYKDSAYNHPERLLKDKKSVFEISVFLARSDGAFRKEEKEYIANYLLSFDDKMIVEQIVWRLEHIKPAATDFEKALKNICEELNPDEKEKFKKTLSKLYEIDKKTPEKDDVYKKTIKVLE